MPKGKPRPVRLFKVLRELNVAADTIVQTLSDRGFELDDKLANGDINARLSPEMYATVVEIYSEDAEAKARVRGLREEIAAEEGEPEAEEEPPSERDEEVDEPEEPAEVEAEPVAEEEKPEAVDGEEEAVESEAAHSAPAAEEEPSDSEMVPEDEEPVADVSEEEGEVEPVVEEGAPEGEKEVAEPALDDEEEPLPDDGGDAGSKEEVDEEIAEEPSVEAPEAEAEASEEQEPDAEGENVVRAGRYQLSGTKVIGKVDLSNIESGKRRRRKRKKKKSVDADKAGASAKKKGRKRRKRKSKVDETEVEANVQETLQQMEQRSSRRGQKRRRQQRAEREAEREAERQRLEEEASTIQLMEFVSTGELAGAMGLPVTDVISKGFELGQMVSINQRLDADMITLLADEFGYDVDFVSEDDEALLVVDEGEDAEEDLATRVPVITIMGHVDHGKTSLLDYIRRENVVAGEAGGITQHIGAYRVQLEDGREMTFLDTPGHEAFTAMRARGAQVTDLVILVVAADDDVMPQTIEAINHARAAEVPMVVAINKTDRPEADPDRIMAALAEQNVLVEQYGGQVQAELISALNGDGVDSLLDKVLVESELLELKANPNRHAVGTVIESRLEKGRGIVVTVLNQNGTMKIGDPYVVGSNYGRVRAMFDERDQRVQEAGPSTPVQVIGFEGRPSVGDRLVVMEDESDAREIAQRREQVQREHAMQRSRRTSLAELSRRMALEVGDIQELNLVVKADVGGSAEAISDALLKIANDEVAVHIVHAGVGAITESDVMLAAASDAIILGFQVRPVPGVRAVAEREEIDIQTYSVIYDAIQDIRDALEGMLSPEEKETVNGMLEVRDTFKVSKVGTIAGCYVVEGKVTRNDRVRLLRDGVVVYDGEIDSLKRFKDDVREVTTGYECGLGIANFNDMKVGDTIEAYVVVEEKRTLEV